MAVVRLGEWLPDQADYRNPGAITATNVVPTASGYAPVRNFVSETNALDNRPRGAATFRDLSGDVRQYAGDQNKLYERLVQTWTDRSKTGGYSTASEERWEFTRWNDKILATNYSNSPQQLTLGGTAFSDLTTAFEARHIDVVRDFVVVGNTNDSTDGIKPNRVRWSAIGDETDWTVSATTLSDFQDLPTGGAVRKVVGGEYGTIICERSVYRMSFTGPPTAFQFDEILPNVGAVSAGSVARDGDSIYLLSERGFYVISGAEARPIGSQKVDQFVLDDLDFLNAHRISTVVDVSNKRILWAYPGADSGGPPNRIVVYDVTLDRWSLINADLELLYRAAGVSTTLDSLDSESSSIDTLEGSLDDAKYQGGVSKLGAFDASNRAGSFSGSAMPATIDTKEMELNEARMTRLNAFRPVVDGGTVTARVATRDNQADSPTFGPSLSQTGSGRFTTRANARYHRFRLQITGEWTDAIGVQISPDEALRGERRG